MKQYPILVVLCSITLFSCNTYEENIPEEVYDNLFKVKEPDKPYINYEDMVVHPCNPTESELDFVYPGVEITDVKRTYKVTIGVSYTEKDHAYVMAPTPNSQFQVRYISPEGKLMVLRNYPHEGKEADLKNGESFRLSFAASSGYPLYLAVSGFGFNKFDLFVDLWAEADDGLLVVPPINYMKFLSKDGDVDLEPFCEKVILP